LDLWDNVRHLDDSTLRWLRKNLIDLINNVGSQATLDTILNKVLGPNNIGLSSTVLGNSELTPVLNPNADQSRYHRNPAIATTQELTPGYTTNSPVKTISDLTAMSLRSYRESVGLTSYRSGELAAIATDMVSDSITMDQRTKILDFGDVSVFKEYNKDIVSVTLDLWLDAAISQRYSAIADVVDPNTKTVYRTDPLSGILMFYMLLHEKLGMPEPSIMEFTVGNIPSRTVTRKELSGMSLHTTGIGYVIDVLLGELASIRTEHDKHLRIDTGLTPLLGKYISYYIKTHDLSSNMDNSFMAADIMHMSNAMFITKRVTVPNITKPTPISTVLRNRGVIMTRSDGYDPLKAMTAIFSTFTNELLDETLVIKNVFDNYKILLDKLTSYTTQIVPATVSGSNLELQYSTIAPIKADIGYIAVTAAHGIKVLEDFPSTNAIPVNGTGDDFIEQVIPNALNAPVTNVAMGNFSISARVNDLGIDHMSITKPVVDAEVLTGVYDVFAPGHATVYGSTDRTTLTNAVHTTPVSSITGSNPGGVLYGHISNADAANAGAGGVVVNVTNPS